MTASKPLWSTRSPNSYQTSSENASQAIDNSHPALKGAFLAFSASPASPKPLASTHSGHNGALAAATSVGMGRRRTVERGRQGRDSDASRAGGEPFRTPPQPRSVRSSASGSLDTLEVPGSSFSSRQQSPSHIAATLAAARSTPTSSPLAGASSNTASRRPSPVRSHSEFSLTTSNTDATSIAPTNKLVEIFESRNTPRSTASGKAKPSLKSPRSIVSPTPIRPPVRLRPPTSTFVDSKPVGAEFEEKEPHQDPPLPPRFKDPFVNGSSGAVIAAVRSGQSAEAETARPDPNPRKKPPELPPPRRMSRQPAITRPRPSQTNRIPSISNSSSSTSSYASAPNSPWTSRQYAKDLSTNETPTNDPILLPPNIPRFLPPKPNSPPKQPSRRASSYASARPSISNPTPTMTADSLANAIVASSLASSRAPSPTKPNPPLPRRQSKSHLHFSTPHFPSRTPSPSKHPPPTGMRHTMRPAPPVSSSSSDHLYKPHRHHAHLMRKHPNKHAEGGPKRWRDRLSEPERKRYEGLWAANRGILLPGEHAYSVCNLVVRDLWGRSNLSRETLAAIWDLVDREGLGRLSREEFVVGLWLVDGCLRGRKAPVKVGESVWSSVRGLVGVRVRSG